MNSDELLDLLEKEQDEDARFVLRPEQNKKVDAWVKKQNRKTGADKNPYRYGAIGGAFTYSFTPTNLGMVIKVFNSATKEEIDVSDYEDW